jgi:hypothetical protein
MDAVCDRSWCLNNAESTGAMWGGRNLNPDTMKNINFGKSLKTPLIVLSEFLTLIFEFFEEASAAC